MIVLPVDAMKRDWNGSGLDCWRMIRRFPRTSMDCWRRLFRAIAVVCVAGILPGCGTVVVDFAIEAQVMGRSELGVISNASPGEIEIVPRPQGLASPFPAVRFRNESLDWTFGTGTFGFGGNVTNRMNSPLCLRFDEAKIASNLHPEEIPMKVYSMIRADSGRWTTLGTFRPEHQVAFVPSPLCIDPHSATWVSFGTVLEEVFPTRRMFNVQWADGDLRLADRGVGNWFRIVVPVELERNRNLIEVTLTATDSRARISNF